MGRLRSSIEGFDGEGAKFRFGSIMTDGESVTFEAEKGHEEMMRIMSTEPLMLAGAETVYPGDEPERFVRNLWLAYHGSRVWAEQAVDF